MNLIPLFLISLAAVGYETALTRYFAVAKWSEYGYWVISIVMVGFALSGVVLALWRDVFARRAPALMATTCSVSPWLTRVTRESLISTPVLNCSCTCVGVPGCTG